jgi:hypothetical protein
MARGKACSICTGENVSQVNALIASGIKLKEIATHIPGLSVYALSRHKRNCRTPGSAAPIAESVDAEAQLKLWVQRADDLYNASGAALDLRGQSAAISAAFRAMEFRFKHQERMEEQVARDLPSDPEAWTGQEREKMRSYLDEIIHDVARTPFASPEAILLAEKPETLRMFATIARDPALLVAVQSLIKSEVPA